MAIQIRWHSPNAFKAAVWDETKPEESLADLRELAGQPLVAEKDGTVLVRTAGGEIQQMRHGWWVWLDDDGGVVVASPGRAAGFLVEDPRGR